MSPSAICTACRWFTLVLFALPLLAALPAHGGGQAELDRYKVIPNPTRYPQSSPQKTLESVITAVTAGDFDYLMGYLADPDYVDARVAGMRKEFTGPEAAANLLAFDKVAKQVARHFRDDPTLVAELRRLAKDGKWTISAEGAVVEIPAPDGARAYFKNVRGHWHLDDRREARKGKQ